MIRSRRSDAYILPAAGFHQNAATSDHPSLFARYVRIVVREIRQMARSKISISPEASRTR